MTLAPPRTGALRRAALLPVLGLGAVVVSCMQALVVPAVDAIARDLAISTAAATWAVTINLLACAVLTPVLGRLGDLHGRRRLMAVAIGACLAGSLLAALTSSFALLLLARVLQGASGAVFPLAIGIVRDEREGPSVTRTTAVVSGMLSFGAGVGLVACGLLTVDGGDYHRVFWFATIVSAVTLAGVWWAIPHRAAPGGNGRLDYAGAVILAGGLLLVLLALTEAPAWGLASPRFVACLAAGLGVLTVWLWWERRVPAPLVDPVMLADRPVLVTNLAGLFVGLANFTCFLGVVRLVQSPGGDGLPGFDASVLTTALVFLLPGTIGSAIAAQLGGELVHRFGPRRTLASAGLLGAAGFAGLATIPPEAWVIVACTIVVLSSVSIAYAAMPMLLMAATHARDTAVANAMNSIARWVGGALGSALVVSVLASAATPSPAAFTAVFLLACAGCAASVLLVLRGLPHLPHPNPT